MRAIFTHLIICSIWILWRSPVTPCWTTISPCFLFSNFFCFIIFIFSLILSLSSLFGCIISLWFFLKWIVYKIVFPLTLTIYSSSPSLIFEHFRVDQYVLPLQCRQSWTVWELFLFAIICPCWKCVFKVLFFLLRSCQCCNS